MQSPTDTPSYNTLNKKRYYNKLDGFTLIELSVVLVIIGLIVGGLLVGRDLIRTAGLRKIISEINTYNASVSTFRTKYDLLPGDMPRAIANTFFDFTASGFPSYGCDGVSDGVISQGSTESVCFWIELYLAKLSTFYPRASACNSLFLNEDQEGYTVPQSSYTDVTGYKAINTGNWWTGTASTNRFQLASRGGTVSGCAYRFIGGAVSPSDAYYIDSKIDDGSPDNASSVDAQNGEGPIDLTHRVTAVNGSSIGSSTADQVCYTGASYPTTSGTYNTTNPAKSCVLRFLMNN